MCEPTRRNGQVKMDYVPLLIAALIWGGNAIVTKASAGVISPAGMAFYRWALAIVLLTPFVAPGAYENRTLIRRQLGRLAVLGILGFAAFPGLMYIAAQFTSAINIGIIQSLMPLLVLGLSIALLGHRLTPGAVAGGLMSLAGVALVVSHGRPALLVSHAPNTGDMIMLAAAACYAVYVVLLKHWHPGIPLLQSLYVQAWAAALTLLPFYLLSNGDGLNTANMPLIAYAAVLASIVAPLVWMHGIGRVGPARASLFLNLVPVVTAGLATVLLAETLNTFSIVGGSMTIGGVMIAELWRPRVTPSPRSRAVPQNTSGQSEAEGFPNG